MYTYMYASSICIYMYIPLYTTTGPSIHHRTIDWVPHNHWFIIISTQSSHKHPKVFPKSSKKISKSTQKSCKILQNDSKLLQTPPKLQKNHPNLWTSCSPNFPPLLQGPFQVFQLSVSGLHLKFRYLGGDFLGVVPSTTNRSRKSIYIIYIYIHIDIYIYINRYLYRYLYRYIDILNPVVDPPLPKTSHAHPYSGVGQCPNYWGVWSHHLQISGDEISPF